MGAVRHEQAAQDRAAYGPRAAAGALSGRTRPEVLRAWSGGAAGLLGGLARLRRGPGAHRRVGCYVSADPVSAPAAVSRGLRRRGVGVLAEGGSGAGVCS